MIVRDEQPGDAAAICEVTTQAFTDAPHAAGIEGAIVDALRAADALTVSLVAEVDGEIVGHIAFSPVTIADAEGDWFGLGPVSVRPDRQGAGIGAALIGAGLARLRATGAASCVVLGDPAYYQRFGFVGDGPLFYPDVPAEYMQALPFGDGAMQTGEVTYHPGFDAE
jgi:putative acetyltransferase